MSNQRKISRKKLAAFTPVYDLHDNTLLGYVGDLTPQGVMVIGEKPIKINKQLTLGVDLLAVRITLSARAAWCRQDEKPNYYNLGFEFLDVSPDNSKVIEAILKRYQFRHVMSLSDLKS